MAALLHDIGIFVSLRGHHKHAQYILSVSEIFGLCRDDMAIISNVARYHRRGAPNKSHLPFMALDSEDRVLVNKLGAILRVANALDADHLQKVRDVRVVREEDQWVLEVDGGGDMTIERLAALARSDLLVEVFGRKVAFREGRPRVKKAEEARAGAVPEPRAVVARVQRPRPRGGLRRDEPAPRAAQVRVHRRVATSTSSSWCGWPRSRTRSSRATPPPTSPASARSSSRSGSASARTRWSTSSTPSSPARSCPRSPSAACASRAPTSSSPRARGALGRYFRDEVLPALTPLAIDTSRPFPMLAGLSLNLAVLLAPAEEGDEPPPRRRAGAGPAAAPRPPAGLDGMVQLLLEDVIRAELPSLFPGQAILDVAAFRVSRDSELDLDDEGGRDFLQLIEEELREPPAEQRRAARDRGAGRATRCCAC